MIKRKFFAGVLLTVFSFLVLSCGSYNDGNVSNNQLSNSGLKRKKLNLIVLLGISDRINTSQIERDQTIIEEQILKLFENIQINSRFNSNDLLTVSIASQPNSKINFSKYKNLSIDMADIKTSEQVRQDFEMKKTSLLTDVKSIYSEALKNPPNGSADIYDYFKNSLPSKIKSPQEYQNKLIIVTDGYLSFSDNTNRPEKTYISEQNMNMLRTKRDWNHIFENEGMRLKSFPFNAENLEILMLEMNPKTFQSNTIDNNTIVTDEKEILDKFWQTWFENLGIIDFELIKQQLSVVETKDYIDKFLKKKSLTDKMTIPLDLKGKNYQASIIANQKEVVSGKDGKWFVIDLTNAMEEKVVYFERGEYVLKNTKECQVAINEFIENVLEKLNKANVKNYEIYVKGGADKLGKDSFEKGFTKGYEYKTICFLPKYKNSDYFFADEETCVDINKVNNNNLPNLRAKFLKEEFDKYFVGEYKSAKILDGSVAEFVSDYERNGTLILFLPKELFNN